MAQLLTNLASNAVEAMEGQEGEIILGMDVIAGTEIREAMLLPLDFEPKAKEYVCISIADTGRGMDAETPGKIFDP